MDYVLSQLAQISDGWKIFFLSMIPISELRLAIPLGIAWGIAPWQCFLWAIAGNFLPIIPLLLLIPGIYHLLQKIRFLESFFNRFIEKTRRKGHQVEKYGALGLALFVAVPLPGTGVWSGCLLAFLLGIKFPYAIAAITVGEILAGLVIIFASMGVMAASQFLYGLEIVAICALALVFVYWVYKKRRK